MPRISLCTSPYGNLLPYTGCIRILQTKSHCALIYASSNSIPSTSSSISPSPRRNLSSTPPQRIIMKLRKSGLPKTGDNTTPPPFYLHENPPPYCYTCGRLMSKVQHQKEERKYCSGGCRRRRPRRHDVAIEDAFVDLLNDTKTPEERRLVSCTEVQESFFGLPENSVRPLAEYRTEGDIKAEQREAVRRAARRGVIFGFAKYNGLTRWPLCEAVQEGKVVEPSFAKGDFSIRWRE